MTMARLGFLFLAACHCTLGDSALLRPLRQHAALIEEAKALQRKQQTAPATNDVTDVTWARLWLELKQTQQASFVVPASILSLGLSVCDLVVPRIRGQLFDLVLAHGNGGASAAMALMWPRLRLLTLLALLGWALNISSAILFARARWSAAMANRVRLMDSLLAQEPAWYDQQPAGELSSRLLTEPERLETLANRGPERALNALISAGGALLLMLSLDWRLALLAVCLRAPFVGQLAKVAGKTVGLLGMLQQHALSRANALASEALANPHSVAAHGARESVQAEYACRCEEYMGVIRATLLSETVLRFTRLGIDSATSLLLLGFGLQAVLRGRISLGALTAFYAYADSFADGCQKLQELLHDIFTVRPSCSRYFSILDRTPKMAWRSAEEGAAGAGGAHITPASCAGELELNDVSISFDGRSEAALRHVSLKIQAGETLALVGPSGAGKSTLLRLLNRLYDPDEGEVRLDGVDVRRLDLLWLRTQFGYVAQHPALFDSSVAYNVAFGALERPPTPARVEEALRASGAAEFVDKLPGGAEATIGEGGRRLSGGQRQRVAVARALARNAPVLLWDEATSSLDGASERLVHDALLAQRDMPPGGVGSGGRRTAVLVAHRLSTVLCAEKVAVIKDGRVEQYGTPAELAAVDGWYRRNFYPD